MSWEAEEYDAPPSEPPAKRRQRHLWQTAAKYAFKILCSDELTKMILGARGSNKVQIQEDTMTKLIFSNKGDYFPNSCFRVLVIYADEITSILQATEVILALLIELAESERQKPPTPGAELIGKDPGEYVLRLCISKETSSALIGKGGANIKQLRADAQIKMFIDNETVCGHQLVRVIGQPDAILVGCERVQNYVHIDAGTEGYHEWSHFVNFSEALDVEEARWDKPHRHSAWEPTPPPRAARGGKALVDTVQFYGGSTASASSAPAPPHGGDAAGYAGVDELVEIVNSMPSGTADVDYQVSFKLRADLLPFVEEGEFFRYLADTTGAKVEIEEEVFEADDSGAQRQLSLTGPLMRIYAAHIMLMKKVADLEREEQEEAERGHETAASVEELRAKMAELQRQLDQARAGSSGDTKGTSKGKSKGKTKGKTKGKGK